MKLPRSLLSCFSLVLLPSAAFAATASNTVGISATVTASCNIAVASDLAFGSLSVGMLPKNVTTSFNVTCTNTTSYSIGLNEGTAFEASTTNRKLGGTGTATLSYALYQDSARQTNWGNASGTWMTGLTGTGSEVAHTIYGQIPVQTWPAPDSYSDTVTITVTY